MTKLRCRHFNPPVPCGTGHRSLGKLAMQHQYFNPPVPRGTGRPSLRDACGRKLYFNPPVPCGTGRCGISPCLPDTVISIHPSLAGRDALPPGSRNAEKYFNPPVPRGTGPDEERARSWVIQFQSTRPSRDGTFNSLIRHSLPLFQSTRPSRDGTLHRIPGKL